jgi:hypothetical protein
MTARAGTVGEHVGNVASSGFGVTPKPRPDRAGRSVDGHPAPNGRLGPSWASTGRTVSHRQAIVASLHHSVQSRCGQRRTSPSDDDGGRPLRSPSISLWTSPNLND